MGEHLLARFDKEGPKRILALDGGGARGLLSLGVLQKLEDHLGVRSGNPNNFRLADYFDLIGGTSTGAIIATTLALGWKVHQIRDLYFDLLPAIFDKPRVPGPLRILIPAFKNTALTKALREHFGDRMLNSDDLRTGLAIHAKRIDTGSAWVLVNHPRWNFFNKRPEGHGIPNSQFYLRDLVQASAAAPTYFDDVRISLARKGDRVVESGHFFDGGVSPNNNPALQLLLTATEPAFGFEWKMGESKVLIWSIGTGYVRKQFRKQEKFLGLFPKPPERRSSAKATGDLRRMMYSSKVLAALEGYNHDISQQQITILQALSRPRFPWHVNSEVRMQIATPLLSGAPVLTYQRMDARLEVDDAHRLRPEHIEALLGREMDPRQVDKLRQLDISNRELLDILYRAGEGLGSAQLIHRSTEDDKKPVLAPALAADWPPVDFDLEGWHREAPRA